MVCQTTARCLWKSCRRSDQQGELPQKQYEILWEQESELGERIAAAWGEAGQKSNLSDITKGLD
jgi:hypothetical protein